MIVGYEGTAGAVAAKHDAVTAVLAGLGGTDLGEEPGRAWAARPVRRAVPPRLAARRRRPGRDPGDRDVLVQPRPALRRREGRAGGGARRRDGALPHQPRLRDRRLALLHRRRARPATTRSRSGRSPRPPPPTRWSRAGATITHHHAVGTDHKPWFARGDRPGRRPGPARGQGVPRPDRRPQPRGADPVTPTATAASLPRQPGLRRRRRPRGGGPGRAAAPRRRRRGRGDLLARTARDAGPRRRPRSTAATWSSASAATGCSPPSPGWCRRGRRRARRAARGPRQRLRPDARPARSPAEQARPCCSSGRTRAGRPDRLADEPARRRLGLRRGRRPGRRDRRPARDWLPGPLQYPYAALRSLATYRPGRYRLSVDGDEREYSAATVVVANSAYYGKGMRIAPGRRAHRRPARRRRDRGRLAARADAGAARASTTAATSSATRSTSSPAAGRAARPRPARRSRSAATASRSACCPGLDDPPARGRRCGPGALTVLVP